MYLHGTVTNSSIVVFIQYYSISPIDNNIGYIVFLRKYYKGIPTFDTTGINSHTWGTEPGVPLSCDNGIAS